MQCVMMSCGRQVCDRCRFPKGDWPGDPIGVGEAWMKMVGQLGPVAEYANTCRVCWKAAMLGMGGEFEWRRQFSHQEVMDMEKLKMRTCGC